ncbi:MAG: hypothetical protein WC843_06305 [Candidatus Gracilibacteria bacterium]|jgi:predicted RNase H-like HicB family nuclease
MKIIQSVKIGLQVTVIKQGKQFVAYAPALDISTSGKTLKEAQKRFSELVNIFIDELIEKNTLEEVFTGLGWSKVKKQWEPPEIVSQKSVDIRLPVAA